MRPRWLEWLGRCCGGQTWGATRAEHPEDTVKKPYVKPELTLVEPVAIVTPCAARRATLPYVRDGVCTLDVRMYITGTPVKDMAKDIPAMVAAFCTYEHITDATKETA